MENVYQTYEKNHVLFAPEGFVDSNLVSSLSQKETCIIQMRYLADGPVFQVVRHSGEEE